MPVVTGAVLCQRVRDYADQPSDGQPTKSYITDTMIYGWLSKGYRAAVRAMARAGYPLSIFSEEFVAPGASVTLDNTPAVINGVYLVSSSTHKARLPRLVDTVEPSVSGSGRAQFWSASVAIDGTTTINLYPSETNYTIQVNYVPESNEIASGSESYIPSTYEDVIILGAALRCLARSGERNEVLKELYNEAVQNAEAEAAHFTSEAAIRNTDDQYPPGYDQTWTALDFAPFVIP